MLDILNFIFQDFWHWLGTVVLLCCIPIPFSRNGLINIENKNKKEG